MIPLPDAHPAAPRLDSAGAYLWWLARRQWRTLTLGGVLGVAWMLPQALLPYLIGRTVDDGVVARDVEALLGWCLAIAGLGVVQAVAGVFRHRTAVSNWMQAALRSIQLLGHHAADSGPAVTATAATGEVVSGVANDAPRAGEIFDVSARFIGACAACTAVAVLVLRTDLTLGLTILVGIPVLSATLIVVVRPLQLRQMAQREAEGRLNAIAADTVAGLRVLRGFGGERQFVQRYRARSHEVRDAGIGVAGVQATLDAAHVLLPGLFGLAVTWLGARAAVTGRITPGELITLYGYSVFLAVPLATATETLGKLVRARVAAGRIVRLLRIGPERDSGPDAAAIPPPPPGSELIDPATGLRVRPGGLTGLVSPTLRDAARLADRLARLDEELPAPARLAPLPSPTLGGVPLRDLDVDAVRRRILVSEAEPRLFSGTLRHAVDPEARHTDEAVLAALDVADAGDVLDALGLDGEITERGRSLSGGQRQRLALARALLADPEVLVLVEPTSAVDAHTEARIADRLRTARAGRATLVATASPLLLDRTDRVAFLDGDRIVAEGAHRELVRDQPDYRAAVLRGEDDA